MDTAFKKWYFQLSYFVCQTSDSASSSNFHRWPLLALLLEIVLHLGDSANFSILYMIIYIITRQLLCCNVSISLYSPVTQIQDKTCFLAPSPASSYRCFKDWILHLYIAEHFLKLEAYSKTIIF